MPDPINLLSLVRPAAVASKHLKLLIYGESGCGKTTLVAGAPNPLLIDCERGATVLVKTPALAQVPVIKLRTLPQFLKLFDELKSGAGDVFETIIIDTVSELQKLFLDNIISDAAAASRNGDDYTVPDNGWNRNTQYMRRLLAELIELPKHVIVTAHVDESDEIPPRKTPLLTKVARKGFISLMDCVGYMEQKVNPETNLKERSIQTLGTARITAKSRLDVADLIKNPTIMDFIESHDRMIKLAEASQVEAAKAKHPANPPLTIVKPDTTPTPNLGLNI